jgi:hypothetical protein
MTPKEIRERRKGLLSLIDDLERQIRHVQVDLEHLQTECEHPHLRHYKDISGVGCETCPDCGYDS